MNMIVRWIIGGTAVLLACLVLYLKLNPPLESEGFGWSEHDPGTVTVELQNEGIHKLKLTEVMVNGGERPSRTELGVSRTNALIGMFALEKEIEGISFHDIHEYDIEMMYSRVEAIQLDEQDNRSAIRHYGLALEHCKKIDSVIVKYTYFGFPFTKIIEIERIN
ncbi:hypothetical protein HP456_01820 [Bacillus haikouensis]|uniref:hypothetical protein n=1 Tax=Bacillus haikouensis TaxID=1510468 RepID=UPI001556645E|nr:hypothetical protein [Bacillus haikouensis]NQD64661.1 hypothetical protein [Bacillus haikouensis]